MNRFFTLLFAASCLNAVGQVPDYVPGDDLVMWLDFDAEGTIPVANAIEPAADRFGEDSSAVQIQEVFPTSYVGVASDSARTVSFWVNRTCSGGGLSRAMIYWGEYGPAGETSAFGFDYGAVGVTVDIASAAITWSHGPLYSSECWNHYVFVLPVGGSTLNDFLVFENGLELTTRLLEYNPSTEVSSSDSPILLGSVNAVNQCPVNPILDEIGVWRRQLTLDEIEQLYSESPCILGCTDALACNFESGATVSDNSCNYDCQFCSNGTIWNGELQSCVVDPLICGAGTVWDDLTQTCIVANNESVCDLVYDGNGDGVVGASDLLGLLTEYGAECTPETAFTCGDPVSYQDYDYATVLIGEQCWFAENLRSENYRNGVTIPSGLGGGFDEANEWGSTTDGAMVVYGEGPECNNSSPDIDACDPAQSLNEYGRLYNWYAVDDARGLCPSGWHVPMDEEWMTMEMALGMSEVEVNNAGYRGTDQGTQLRTTYGWSNGGNGTNSSGFSGLPGGVRVFSAQFDSGGYLGLWWTSSLDGSGAWHRQVNSGDEEVLRATFDLEGGLSVRCIKDSE